MGSLPDHVDVLIVGAGISGVGTAYHLQAEAPGKSYAILESRESMGGTWDLFRYPGIRSDSDMYTLGYSFKPWTGEKSIADGDSIRDYIRETASEHGITDKIHYNRRVRSAEWSSADARWTVEVACVDGGAPLQITCGFLFGCTGYYRYDDGFTPDFEGTERFTDAGGQIVHPQHWPSGLDYSGKRVVVIGSGATAVTLVPSMASGPDSAEHVTMLQRSPSYVLSLPASDPFAKIVRRLLPEKAAYTVIRWKNVLLTTAFFQISRSAPKLVAGAIKRGVRRMAPDDLDVDTHFTPRYDPWDQRVCLVPDEDLFRALRSGEASVVTDDIESFTEAGLKLRSGAELEADVIVTATGLNLLALGGIELVVDGEPVDLPERVGYKGMMLSGVPNAALTLGYTNASWTLKADLVASYICRLLNHMDERGYAICTPVAPAPSEPTEPFIDLKAGYVLRSIDQLPRQGLRSPWRLHQNYARDIVLLRHGSLEDEGIEFARAGERAVPEQVPA